MRDIILYDSEATHTGLLPITFTRPASEITVGLTTIRQKWERLISGRYSWDVPGYMAELYPNRATNLENALTINASVIPSADLAEAVLNLAGGQRLVSAAGVEIARVGAKGNTDDVIRTSGEPDRIVRPFDIFRLNGKAITEDFAIVKKGRESQPLSQTNTLIGNISDVFIEEGAKVEGAILNTTHGPIYIGPEAEVMEGSCLRGPIAIMDDATVNMGTRIYGDTTIGIHCKVGGELNNVVMLPYSNKAHDGFLGNAVIGSWCNLGAGCTASNLKNDYTEIKLWDYASRRFLRTGLQFCGLIMGDHSKAGINTMFNTATTVGVGVNIHGTGYPRNFIPSFSEGSAGAGFSDVSLTKFFAIAERVMARRDLPLTDADRRLFEAIHSFAETLK